MFRGFSVVKAASNSDTHLFGFTDCPRNRVHVGRRTRVDMNGRVVTLQITRLLFVNLTPHYSKSTKRKRAWSLVSLESTREHSRTFEKHWSAPAFGSRRCLPARFSTISSLVTLGDANATKFNRKWHFLRGFGNELPKIPESCPISKKTFSSHTNMTLM